MNKFTAIFGLLRAGSVVADPVKWKNRQITVNVVAAFVMALFYALEVFGVAKVPLAAPEVEALAAGLLALVNGILTVATSDKVGLPPKTGDSP